MKKRFIANSISRYVRAVPICLQETEQSQKNLRVRCVYENLRETNLKEEIEWANLSKTSLVIEDIYHFQRIVAFWPVTFPEKEENQKTSKINPFPTIC